MSHTRIEINTEPPLTELIDRATSSEIITLTDDGQEKAVLLSMEAYEHLTSTQSYQHQKLMPLDEFRSQFQQALAEAGHNTRSEIIDLVQDIKQEIDAERFQSS